MGEHQPMGEMLVRKGKITPEQLQTALRSSVRRRIGEVLVALGFVTERDVAQCLGEQFGFKVVDPDRFKASPAALGLLSSEVALSHRILPLRYSSDCIECLMADPIDFPTTDMISQLAGRRTAIHLSPASALVAAIRRAYGIEAAPSEIQLERSRTRSAPKPQRDRVAILAQLDGLAEGA